MQLETELRSGALARRSHPTTSSSFASPNEEVFLGAHAARAMQGGRGHGRGGAGGRGGVSKRSRGGSDRDSIPVDGADEASPEQGDSEHKAAAENEAQVEDDVLGAEALPSSASGKSKGSKKSKRTAGKGNGMGGNLSAENGGMSKAVDSVDLTDKGGNGSSRILDTEEDPGSDRRPSETEGSGERRGVERGDTKGVSRPVKDGGVRDRRGGGGGGVGGGSGVVFEPLPSLHAVMFSYAQVRIVAQTLLHADIVAGKCLGLRMECTIRVSQVSRAAFMLNSSVVQTSVAESFGYIECATLERSRGPKPAR